MVTNSCATSGTRVITAKGTYPWSWWRPFKFRIDQNLLIALLEPMGTSITNLIYSFYPTEWSVLLIASQSEL